MAVIEYRIERRSGLATYLQIVQQTKQALRLGVLQPGDRLPTAKEVVASTAVNPNTVLKAYRELEREGLVEPRPGAGTFVRRSLARDDTAADGPLRAALDGWMRQAHEAGLEIDDVDALFAAVRDSYYMRGGLMTEDTVLRTEGLGKRFGRRWALRDCTLELPRGRIAALVGPNAAGKTTLLKLATGLVAPTEGAITALGVVPGNHGTPVGLSFMAQEKPLYRTFRVAEMLRAGAVLNSGARWDAAYAQRLVDDAGIPSDARISTLSGGQRTRIALALALARRPDLLLVDEPLADLDPLARRQVMSTLLAEVAETGMTVLMASHVIAELDGVCDHLLLMRGGRVELAGDIDDLLADHHLVTGLADVPVSGRLVHERRSGRQRTALVRGPVDGTPGSAIAEPTLEELVLGHLEAPTEHAERGVPA